MNIKNWYDSLKSVQTAIDSMNGLNKFTDNMNTEAATALTKEYSAAVKGLTKDQAAFAMTMAKVDAEKQKEILNDAKLVGSTEMISASRAKQMLTETTLTEEQQKKLLTEAQLLESDGVSIAMTEEKIIANIKETNTYKALSDAQQEELISQFEKIAGNGAETVSREVLIAKMKEQLAMQLKLIATNPVTWIVAGVAAFFALDKAYGKLTTSEKEATDAVTNAITESQNQVKSVREQKDTIDQLSDSYEKLSKGVNTATNENLSLNTDDYKEYLDTCNQIADIYPELVTGYDAQGNAILSLKGNVEGLTDAYKQAQQEAYATAYLGTKDEDGKYSGGISDVEKEFKYSQGEIDPGNHFWERDFSTTTYIDAYKKLLDLSDEELRTVDEKTASSMDKNLFQEYSKALEDAGLEWADLTNATDEQLATCRSKLEKEYQEYQNVQKEAIANAKSSLEGYMKGITDAGGIDLASGYDKLTEKQQNLATSLLSSLDESKLQEFADSGDFEGAAKKWVNNIVSSISTMSAEAKNAYDELQDSIANPSDLTSAGIGKIDEYLNTLADELGVTKDKLKDIFNLDDIFDTESSFSAKIDELFSGLTDSKVQEADDALDHFKYVMQEVQDMDIDLDQTVFGNIDTNNRQVLKWTDDTLNQYKDALQSWDDEAVNNWKQFAADMKGTVSTVYGSSGEYDGVEIAFSPMLQTDKGAVLLSASTVDTYINSLISELGDNWNSEDLLALDAEGLDIDGQHIKNLIADIGDTAVKTGEAMHYVGKDGAVALAERDVEKYSDTLNENIDVVSSAQKANDDNSKSLDKSTKSVKTNTQAIKWLKENASQMTIAQKKMFLEAANGAENTLEAVKNYEKLLENNALNTFSIDITQVTSDLNNLNTALSESASATGLTADSITNLKNMFSGFDDYDASKLFENTANGVKLNYEELQKLNKEYDDQKINSYSDQLDILTSSYDDLTNQINECNNIAELPGLYSQRDAIKEQIDNVQQLVSQYDGLMSAFNEWQTAQSQTSPGANYDSMYSYLETANKLASDGKWGNQGLRKYMELITGQDLSDKTPTKMKEVWDNLDKQIGNTGHNLMEFLTEDKTGIDKFVDTLNKLDEGYIQVGEDGEKIFKADSLQKLASKLGTDVSFVQVMLDKLTEYGWDIQVDSSDIELAMTDAEKANKELKELGTTDYTFNFAAKDTDLDIEIEKAKELLNKFRNEDGTINVNAEGYQQVETILTQLISQREAASQPLIMQIKAEDQDEAQQTLVKIIQGIQNSIDGYQIAVELETNDEEVRKQLSDTLGWFDSISEQQREALGLNTDQFLADISLVKQQLNDNVDIDDDALERIEQKFAAMNPEIMASAGIDVSSLKETTDTIANSVTDSLTSVLNNISFKWDWKSKSIKIEVDTQGVEEDLAKVNEDTDNLHDGNVNVTADNSDAMNKTQEAENEADNYSGMNPSTDIKADNTDANGKVDDTTSKLKDLIAHPWTAIASIALSGLAVLNSAIDKLKSWFTKNSAGSYSANVTTTVSKQTQDKIDKNKQSKGSNGVSRSGYDQVHGGANGTFHGYASGTNVSLQSDEDAVVNELGPEGLLRNGVLHEIPGNAHIEHLKRGDIIFNTKQMDELRRNGYVTSGGGRARIVGGYAYGTLNGISGYDKSTFNKKQNYAAIGGIGSVVSASKKYGDFDSKSSSKSSSGSSSTKSSKNSSGSSSSNTSSSSTSEEAEKTEETLDWIETKISRVERLIKNLGNTVSATYRSWSDRNNALGQELSEVNSEISIQQQAYDRYIQQANSVGLDAGYAQKVRDGKIDIETITDDDLKQKIEDYQNWYNKALDCQDAILDLKDDLYDLAQTNFDNITKQFEDQLNMIEHSVNMVEGYIDLAETRGYLASTDYYDSLIKTEVQNIGTLKNEYDTLANTLSNMTNSGQITKYSEAWYDLYGQICDVEEALQDATKALSDYESKMRELKWSYFEKEQDYITNFTDETQWLIDLLEKQGKLVDDNGNMTNRGAASMGLHAVGYNTYMAQADDYAREIQKLNQELAKDPYNTILIDKRQEYLKAQRDSIDAAYDEIDASKSLIKDAYDAQLDALQKLIEKRKDAMSAEKDLYDYQQSIASKVDTISSYEKQLIAYENDNSEEGMAKRQQIQNNLKDTRKDLQDSQYEQWLTDQQKLLDSLYNNYEQLLNQRLDDINFILNTMLDSANNNAESIKSTLTEATASVGTTLSDTMYTVWNTNYSNMSNIVTAYGNGFNSALTTTNQALAGIQALIQSMIQEAQRKAAEDAAKQAAAAKAVQQQPIQQQPQPQPVQQQSQPQQQANSNGSFFIYKKDSFPKGFLNKENSIVDFS